MAITVTCPSCSTSFPVDPAKIPEGGVNARCSSCGDIFRVEKPVEPDPLPTLEDVPPDQPAPPAEPQAPAAGAQPEAPPASPPQAEPESPPPSQPAAPPSEPAAADPFAQPAPFEQSAPQTGEASVPAETAEPLPAPEPNEPLPPPDTAEAPPAAATDDAEAAPSPQAPAAETAEPAPAEEVAETSAPAVQGFTFGKRDPTDKAKRLARVLVSDMIMYNAERHQSALAQGTLQQDFEEEIEKSWKEFVEQVGEELAEGEGRQYWKDALNDILAKGQQLF